VSGKPEREYGQTWKWGPPICKSCVEGVDYVAVSWQVSWKDTQAVTSRKLDGKAPPQPKEASAHTDVLYRGALQRHLKCHAAMPISTVVMPHGEAHGFAEAMQGFKFRDGLFARTTGLDENGLDG
jgi:hypothetical protein